MASSRQTGRILDDHNSDWLAITLNILRGDLAAAHIVAIDGNEYSDTRLPRHINTADIELINCAVQNSPWIADDIKEDIITRALADEPDAIMSIMLPLLPELCSLGLQLKSGLVQATVARISKAYATDASKETSLPLGKLVLVHTYGYNGGQGGSIGLKGIAPFLALPSMQRVILRSGRDSSFAGWPEELPRPRAQEVYFAQSSVTKSAVASFIKAWDTPCVVRQSWNSFGGDWDVDLDWDHAVVSGEVDPATGLIKDGTRQEVVELRYEETDDMCLLTSGDAGTDDNFSDGLNMLYDGRVYEWERIV